MQDARVEYELIHAVIHSHEAAPVEIVGGPDLKEEAGYVVPKGAHVLLDPSKEYVQRWDKLGCLRRVG